MSRECYALRDFYESTEVTVRRKEKGICKSNKLNNVSDQPEIFTRNDKRFNKCGQRIE